jgi:hypothetical protein
VYGNKYLQRAHALAVDPVSMPLEEARAHKETAFQPPAGLALFGAIRDAAPDSWGRRVIENMLKVAPDSLPETEYLAHAGPHRTGALDFRDSPTAPAERGKLPDIKELSYLLDAAALIQQGRRVPRNLQSLFSVGATLDNALSAAGRFGLLKHAAAQIIKDLSAVVREWRMHFAALGVPVAECDKVASAFRKPKDLGLRAVEKA